MSTKQKMARREARQLIGIRVYFTGRNEQSKNLITKGIQGGVVKSAFLSGNGSGFEFEIDIGEAGAPKFIILPRKAFIKQKPTEDKLLNSS